MEITQLATLMLQNETLRKDGGTKKKIEKLVKEYIQVMPGEYEQVKKEIATYRIGLKDEWAQMEGSEIIARELYRIPETLHAIMHKKLSVEDDLWLRSTEGGRWFANRYPEFRVTKSV